MQESRVLGEEWREDFQAPVTFYSYGADEYELGGIKISGEDILDSALAEQELLLGEMGLSSEAYHITSMDWDGESFMDETGQVCRRASARERGCCVITRLYTEDRFRLWSRFPMRCPLCMNLRNWGIFLIQKKSRKRHWF